MEGLQENDWNRGDDEVYGAPPLGYAALRTFKLASIRFTCRDVAVVLNSVEYVLETVGWVRRGHTGDAAVVSNLARVRYQVV